MRIRPVILIAALGAFLGSQMLGENGLAILDDPDFRAGNYDTGFITQDWLDQHLTPDEPATQVAAIAAAVAAFEAERQSGPAREQGPTTSPWKRYARWRGVQGGVS